jgi:Bacterial archaeo-eukaryotic release factor family 3
MITETSAADVRFAAKETDYTALAAEHVAPCISIYLGSVGAERAAKRWLRLRNILRAAESRLQDFSISLKEAESLLRAAVRAMEGGPRPHSHVQGLAFFTSKDFFSYSSLHESVADRIVVGSEFLVTPLLPLVPRDDRFFVLTLSQKQVKLYEGFASGMRERTLQDIPENVREDFGEHGFERQYQLHTASSHASGQKGAFFHGPSLDEKGRAEHFLRGIARGVASSLKGQQAPLILAAVEYLIPLYRSVNTYAHLADETITGSPSLLSFDELYSAAWKIVENNISKQQQCAFSVYWEHINTPLTSSNLREILAAAQRGLIRFLFVSGSAERWGTIVSPETVHVHTTEERGDHDLLNVAAILTLRHGGQVFVAAPEQLQEGIEAAAVFRFALRPGSQNPA